VNAANQRREIHFSGRVQGVGFRFTARAIAARYPVSGYVRNLSDGRVLLVLEGSPVALEQCVAAIEAEMARYVSAKDVRVLPATGEFSGFHVRP
jgi:acylphosphatase